MSLEYKYMMLDRLKQDCNYYLNYGARRKEILWAGDEQEQINEMRKIYNSLAEKPDYLTIEEINNYEKLMVKQEK